jgi:hypothetical protein
MRQRRASTIRRSEAGETLTELIVAVAILGIAIVAIVGGLADALVSSTVDRGHASANSAARNTAEALQDPTNSTGTNTGIAYVPCATTYSLPAQPNATVAIVSITYWNGSASANPGAFVNNCPSDKGLQRITIKATSGRASDTVTVIKRRNT